MKRYVVSFAELHSALFFGGKNFGLKLEPSKLTGLHLVTELDAGHDRLYVLYNGKGALIGSSFATVTLPEELTKELYAFIDEEKKKNPEVVKAVAPPQFDTTQDKSKRSRAQVSTPQSHVFR